jgi:Acetyltransferases, including N-acetylases of ribosomal proteins
MDFTISLENEDVLLRPLSENDITAFEKITNDKSLWVYFTSDLAEKDELEKWISAAITQIENKTRLAFTIINKANNIVIGSTSFGNFSQKDMRIEIGWTWIGKKFQGRGFNRIAKLLMLEYCFEKINLERVESKTDVLNVPARKALLKLGMVEEGILRGHTLMTNNRRRDTIYYSILKKEWDLVKKNNGWG